MAYYLRFYFEYHGIVAPTEIGLFGTPYAGTAFFDFILPVLEFAPIIVALFLTWVTGFGRRPGPLAMDK